MYQLKKIDLATVALYSFLMFFILGILFVLPLGLLMTLISNSIPDLGGPEVALIPFLSGFFLLIIPVFYAIFGMIISFILALCYNLLSLKLGGIKIDLHKMGELEKSSTVH